MSTGTNTMNTKCTKKLIEKITNPKEDKIVERIKGVTSTNVTNSWALKSRWTDAMT